MERLVEKSLQKVGLQSNGSNSKRPKLQLVWGSTMYHIDDLPFSTGSLPDVYTQFRKVSADVLREVAVFVFFLD